MKPDEVSDLRLRLPKGVSGHTNLRIALVGADGSPIAGAATQLNVANPPISRPEEKELIAGLIAHGQKMIDVAKPEAPMRRSLSEPPTIPNS